MLPEMQESDTPYLKPKKFGEWYALDYFRHSQRLWRHKGLLLWLPLGLCAAWLGLESLWGRWDTFAAGPVSHTCGADYQRQSCQL